MNSKSKILGIALASVLAVAAIAAFGQTPADALDNKTRMTGDITAPSDGNPFGGNKVGNFAVKTDGHLTRIVIEMDIQPSSGNVSEGWLVDAATGYKLSLGQFNYDGKLTFRQNMVNSFTYNMLVITEEPVDDTDPNPATPIGGAALPSPFGQ